ELQFREQQAELERELQQQRSTQQLLEQSYYHNSNSKNVEIDFYRQQPQLITNLNNLNYQTSSNCNYNTINQSSAKDILYELKQYEHFANNSNNFNFNNYNIADRQPSSYNGTNYSQNILNYNNSYYRINNINNYNYVKNHSSSPSLQREQDAFYNNNNNNNNRYQDKYLLNEKMDREESAVESGHLVNTGRNVTIHNFNSNNVTSHTTIPASYNNIDDDDEQHNANPQIHRSQHFTQIIAALAVSLGPLAAGLGKGYSSPAIASLQELHIRNQHTNYTSFSVTDQEASWVASLSLLGALFGGMFGGLAMQYGRKRVLALMSLPFSLSWILTVFAKSVETMFMTAFIGGFCCAIVSMVTQVYISEISSPDIRGFLSAIQKVSGHLGVLISYLLGAYLDWRQLAMLVSVAPMMLFVTVIYIPETPSFLVLKGRDEDAYRSLQWLRGSNKNVELELDTIRSNIRTSRFNMDNNMNSNLSSISHNGLPMKFSSFKSIVTNVKSVLKNARLVKPVLITCGLMIFQRFTGANSFGFYAVKIFRQTFSGMNPHGGAIAVGFVQLLASMLSGLLIDTIGRIPLLIVSSVFMSLALASFGSYVHYDENNGTSGNSDWIPLLCVLIFTIAFSLGISPISWLLIGELFPLEYRGIGSSIATSFSYFCAFLAVKTFVDFQQLLGLDGAFWLFACISCVGLCFVIMVVPETKGKDLEEMDPKYMRTIVINR
ncbi:CLUMA_CG007374, isoform A, partial [Clunio marinus]